MAHRASMRRRIIGGSIVALVILILVPAVVVAATNFEDVPPSNVFYNDIMWMAEAGVTKGCSDTRFCPDDFVTREQMAAFMHRLATGRSVDAGSLGGVSASDYVTHSEIGPTTLDAETLDGLDSTAFLRSTARAVDSDKLDGLHSTAFLRSNARAADSDKLDGLHSTSFLQKVQSPRAGYDFSDNIAEPTSDVYTVVLQTSITAPAKGIVLTSGFVDVTGAIGSGEETVVCSVGMDNSSLEGSTAYITVNDIDPGPNEATCGVTGATVVNAGTYSFQFAVLRTDAFLYDGSMWAMWVPFDGAGAIPSAVPMSTDGDSSEFDLPEIKGTR